jgi:hypothetical protein
MKKVLASILVAVTCSGCFAATTNDFTMTGSAEGIRAFNDGQYSIAKTAKESPDSNSQYAAFRNNQETVLANKKGFLEGLFGGSK